MFDEKTGHVSFNVGDAPVLGLGEGGQQPGKGSGPPDYAADLTDELRFELNTEGVLFYKIWNGHAIQLRTQVDDMPAFSDKLSKDEVWAVVEYVKSLRAPQR